jgi:TRAP-type C4-dicarboxylate transport system permease small subunit
MSNPNNVDIQPDNQGKKEKSILTKALNYAMGFALYAMVFFVFINAVLRYCFNSGWPASEELSRFLFVWVTMLGTIIAYKQNKHVGVDLVIQMLKPKARKVVDIIGMVLTATILTLITNGGFKYLLKVYKTPAPATELPMGIMALALLVCMVAMIGITLIRLIKCLRTSAEMEEN